MQIASYRINSAYIGAMNHFLQPIFYLKTKGSFTTQDVFRKIKVFFILFQGLTL